MFAPGVEHACVVRELGQRDTPGQPRVHPLGPGDGEGALRGEQVEHVPTPALYRPSATSFDCSALVIRSWAVRTRRVAVCSA